VLKLVENGGSALAKNGSPGSDTDTRAGVSAGSLRRRAGYFERTREMD